MLAIGIVFGLLNLRYSKAAVENLNNRRVESSVFIEEVENGTFRDIPFSFIICSPIENENGSRVTAAYKTKTIKEGTIVPTDALFEEESGFFEDEVIKGKTRIITYYDAANERFITFMYDATEDIERVQRKMFTGVMLPIIISAVILTLMLFVNAVYIGKRVYIPVEQISDMAIAICHGDYTGGYDRVSGNSISDCEVSNLIYSVNLMRDEIREQKETADKLRLSEKELVSCISHDLLTPLSTIKAYSEGIRDGIVKEEDERRKYNEVILNKTNTMIDMTRDLLNYSNAQAGQMDMVFSEVMTKDFFISLFEEIRVFTVRKNVDFSYSTGGMNVIAKIDPKRITEVIYNLVENAVKYMDKPERRISADIKVSGSDINIRIEDNGRGIAAEDILYIFDKFYRSEKSRTSSVPGSGLGLSICKYIVDCHKGEIWCESKQGIGTVFYIVLPVSV